jgi:ABC-type iron transport system FetAB ATPase subunit
MVGLGRVLIKSRLVTRPDFFRPRCGLNLDISRAPRSAINGDRLAFRFATQANLDEPQVYDDDEDELRSRKSKQAGFSSGERQLKSLEEIVQHTDAAIYLLDEWDANLDASNRAMADALVEQLAHRARVIEISHRDRSEAAQS